MAKDNPVQRMAAELMGGVGMLKGQEVKGYNQAVGNVLGATKPEAPYEQKLLNTVIQGLQSRQDLPQVGAAPTPVGINANPQGIIKEGEVLPGSNWVTAPAGVSAPGGGPVSLQGRPIEPPVAQYQEGMGDALLKLIAGNSAVNQARQAGLNAGYQAMRGQDAGGSMPQSADELLKILAVRKMIDNQALAQAAQQQLQGAPAMPPEGI